MKPTVTDGGFHALPLVALTTILAIATPEDTATAERAIKQTAKKRFVTDIRCLQSDRILKLPHPFVRTQGRRTPLAWDARRVESFKLMRSDKAWPLFVAAGLFIVLGLVLWFTAMVAWPGALALIIVGTVKKVRATPSHSPRRHTVE